VGRQFYPARIFSKRGAWIYRRTRMLKKASGLDYRE